jgi:hypothetical protein
LLVLVIEDNLCNNYYNIFLNNTYKDLYINEPSIIEIGGEKKIFRRGNFSEKGAKQKNPKEKKNPKPVFSFGALPSPLSQPEFP